MSWADLLPAEKLALVYPLWISGMSANQCAARLETTRNSIIGVISRAKVPKAERTIKPVVPKPSRKLRVPKDIPHKTEPVEIAETAWLPLSGSSPITIMDLPPRSGVVCRWPVAGGYCGLPSGEAVYCATHTRRAAPHPQAAKRMGTDIRQILKSDGTAGMSEFEPRGRVR